MNRTDILHNAISTYGITNQLDMVIEECAELIQAINKAKRNLIIDNAIDILPVPDQDWTIKQCFVYNELCSEVADVRIMISQLEMMLNKEQIDLCEERKLKRLEKRLES